MKTRFTATAAAICILFAGAVSAQEQEEAELDVFGLGDQTFSISAGIILPLFFFGPGDSERWIEPARGHIGLGGTGSLRWDAFINNTMKVGAELGGMFAVTELGRTLVSLPITGTFTYSIRFYPFEVPLHIGAGVNILKLSEDLYVGPVLKPGASFYWNYNAEWEFGARMEYWLVPEIYFGSDGSLPGSHTSYGNFLSITLSTLYHF